MLHSPHPSSWCQRQIFFTVETGIPIWVELATCNEILLNQLSGNVWLRLSIAFQTRIINCDMHSWCCQWHLKHDFQIYNMCHCFKSLDQNEAWQVINFSIYWKWSILSNVLPKIKYFPQKSHGEMKLKKRPIIFNRPCTCTLEGLESVGIYLSFLSMKLHAIRNCDSLIIDQGADKNNT